MSTVCGIHPVAALLDTAPERVRVLLVQRGNRNARLQALVQQARDAGIRVEFVERNRLDRRAEGTHQGVLADCHEQALADEAELEARWSELAQPRLLLVLDGVTDPRNLGACLRSANAAGVAAVLLPRRRSAPLNEVALKTAAGGAEGLLIVEVANLARRLEWLKDRGVWVVGAAGAALEPWTAADLGADCALVLGSEGEGLRALTARTCDQLVRIPMRGSVSSLNVSVAAGILLFEAVRQRAAAQSGLARDASGP
ncbi:MAG: 23S rRNA (guanosine(2251)-2'-O)-methyltransferase RlmB [Pseudomonadales bacterium]